MLLGGWKYDEFLVKFWTFESLQRAKDQSVFFLLAHGGSRVADSVCIARS
jgi:hypothetical protein